MSPGTGAVSDHMSFCTTCPHDLACEKRRRGTAEREEKSKQLLLNPAKKEQRDGVNEAWGKVQQKGRIEKSTEQNIPSLHATLRILM